jgi:[ribosomal protein S18]-alanine N-acetyltransferase
MPPKPSILKVSAEVKIRPFSLDDLKGVLKIQKACKLMAAWRPRDYEQLADDPMGVFLVAACEGREGPELVGFSVFYRVDTEAELWNIAVAPAYRRQGIARALLREACRRLSAAGAQKLFLEVRVSNLPAVELYRSLDFAPLARRKDYYQNPSEDALVLVCKLVPSEV